jgi:hypothetical protein
MAQGEGPEFKPQYHTHTKKILTFPLIKLIFFLPSSYSIPVCCPGMRVCKWESGSKFTSPHIVPTYDTRWWHRKDE